MWKCPKCGREFKNQNQEHFCGEPPKTIDEYISTQSENIQPYLNQIRDTIRAVLPDAQERISWRMPTYCIGKNIILFISQLLKSILVCIQEIKAIENFRNNLIEYKTSKGTVQLPYSKPLPLELIGEIARWCHETGSHH